MYCQRDMKFFIGNGCWNILKVKSDICKLNRSVKCNFLVLFKVRNDKKIHAVDTTYTYDTYLIFSHRSETLQKSLQKLNKINYIIHNFIYQKRYHYFTVFRKHKCIKRICLTRRLNFNFNIHYKSDLYY